VGKITLTTCQSAQCLAPDETTAVCALDACGKQGILKVGVLNGKSRKQVFER